MSDGGAPGSPRRPDPARPGPRLAIDGKLWETAQSPVTVGRSRTNAVVVEGARVSKRHAVLVWDGRRWVLRDLGSSNGTFVDGRRIRNAELAGPCTVNLGGADGPALRISLAALPTPPPGPAAGPRPASPPAPAPRRPALRPPVFRPAAPPTDPPAARPPASRPPASRPPASRPPAPSAPASGPTAPRPPAGPRPPAPGPAAPGPAAPRPLAGVSRSAGAVAGRLRIGRAADNELVVPDLLVSRHHAELRRTKRGWTLIDLGSANGSYVDGVRARHPVELADGQRVTFGNQTFVAVPDGLAPAEAAVVGTALPALAARDLTVQVESGATILDHVSFALEPGQLLAIVGPTGSGKSTLLKALTGSRRPEGGSVEVRGVPLYDAYDELCRTIGYVPQDDILHLPLTIRQALEFGAELRFPADTTDEDRARRVDEVLAELALTHRGDVPIEKVSGGQRKRTSVALELLTRPELLFLDEPTSGLDPGFERTVMELLRELADAGRAVVVVTHSLQSLELCDRVLFLAPGGAIAFFGEPADALGFFGRSDFIEVFRDLEASTPERWSSRGHDRRGEVRAGGDATGPVLAAPRAAPPGQPWKRQVGILARRQRAILQADRQNRWFLAGSVLVPAILILMLVPSNQLSLGQARPVSPRLLLSAIVVATVAMGAANAIREIVKEVPIYLRERAVGLQRSAYLASKLLVVGTLTMAQAAALVLITTLRAGGPDRANVLVQGHLELMVDVALTGLSAVALGLALSTLVSSSEKAMALVPVVFVVQWLFCGAAFNLESRPVMREAARLTSANWGMAAAASSVGENELSHTCSDPPHYADDTGVTYDDYGTPYIDPEVEAKRKAEASRRELAGTCDRRWESRAGPWFTSITALVLLTVGAMWLADRLLARKEPLAAQRASDWPSPWDHGPRREF